jgi:nitrate reductase molybdenum cofactor assembly chaperone NarJ/NarW
LTTGTHHACALLAALVSYPGREYRTTLRSAAAELAAVSADAAEAVEAFAAAVEPLTLGELQQLYTHAFDLSPLCPLDLGWHLFGEQYERGAFLVRMRTALERHGVQESTELPDHLSYVLQLAGRVPPEAMPLRPEELDAALAKMAAALDAAGSPFHHLMRAIQESVHA